MPHTTREGSLMSAGDSVKFFDMQFQRQARDRDFRLNPFELAALPHLHGRVLDFGCGLGNLAFAAAESGCSVVALDASPAAIAHIQQRAAAEALPVRAALADLRDYEIHEDFDAVVSIGLLMFFDCPTAFKALEKLQAHVREGGIAVVNVLTDGTTYLDMFEADSYCLFSRTELESRFAGWNILLSEFSDFEAPGGRKKAFATVIARKPRSSHDVGA
jgi:tellurite methyltransferase